MLVSPFYPPKFCVDSADYVFCPLYDEHVATLIPSSTDGDSHDLKVKVLGRRNVAVRELSRARHTLRSGHPANVLLALQAHPLRKRKSPCSLAWRDTEHFS